MKALIFAAGLGTRLRPLTNDRPKALVEVGGRTMLERVITHVAECGFTDITVNVHHFADKVIDYLREHDNFGLDIHISDERDRVLETGGGILKAQSFLDGDEPFLVHNADILTDLDLNAFYQSHLDSGALASVLVKDRITSRYFLFDNDHRLCGWVNKSTGDTKPDGFVYRPGEYSELAFGGIHVISPDIFPFLQEYAQADAKFSITPFYAQECHTHHIHGYEPAGDYRWIDVGKPETLAQAQTLFDE
ncbi:MAG: nucleotidyltransferase family protein [Muribaculaceae bacterium]|nr:nucleotidyltransferase family protein [Muribaculaceae bacterium]